MTFATPTIALLGALAITIPIAIHFFFRRRQHPIPWAAMDLLRQAIRRTTRRRHIEKITLLILRCLVMLFAGAAIAGPLLRGANQPSANNKEDAKVVVLIVDDGIAQQTDDGDGSAFAANKKQALAVIDDLHEGDRIGIIMAAGARPLIWPPSEDLQSSRAALHTAVVTDIPADISGAIIASHSTTKTIGVLSDFRRGSMAGGFDLAAGEETKRVVITPPSEREVNNTQIIAFEPQARGPLSSRDGVPIKVKLSREGQNLGADHTQVEIDSDDGARTAIRVMWREGQLEASASGIITIPTTRLTEIPLRARLTTADAQPADDTRFAIVATTAMIRIGIVDRFSDTGMTVSAAGGVGSWIERALRPTTEIDIETEILEPTAIYSQRCLGLDAMIVIRPDAIDPAGWAVLAQQVRLGMVVIIVPPADNARGTWSDEFLGAFNLGWTIAREPTQSELGTPIQSSDVPHALLTQISSELQELIQPILVNQWITLSAPVNRGEAILTLRDGTPLILRGTLDGARGSVILFAAPPDLRWTNLPAKPAMVPLFQELVRQSVAQVDRGRQMVLGSDQMPMTAPGTNALRLVMARAGAVVGETKVLAVDPNGVLAQQTTAPGVYTAMDSSDRPTGWVVVNIDPRAASTQPTTIEEITAAWKGASISVNRSDFASAIAVGVASSDKSHELPIAAALKGQSLAMWFFCLLLALLLVETWLARRASTGAVIPHRLERSR